LTIAASMLFTVSCGQLLKTSRRTQATEAATITETIEPADESNAVVYAVGDERLSPRQWFATLWIDGKPMRLTSGKTNSDAHSVVVAEDNTIYVAGANDNVATLWTIKNDKITALPLEKPNRYYSELKDESFTTASAAYSVFVTPNGEVYVAGVNNNSGDKNLQRGMGGLNATVWKVKGTEITRQILQGMEERESSYAYSLYITPNGDVYAAGYQNDYNRRDFASLWKNGTLQVISKEDQNASASGVHVNKNGDVYVVGSATLTDKSAAVIWKNQTVQALAKNNDAVDYSKAEAVFVTDRGDVYAAGYENYSQSNTLVATVWKNGTKQSLTNDIDKTFANSIFVTPGGNVYVGGRVGEKATIWKNGIPQTLADGAASTEVRSVFVKVNPRTERSRADENKPDDDNKAHDGENIHPIDIQMKKDMEANDTNAGLYDAYSTANDAWELEMSKNLQKLTDLLDSDERRKKLNAAQKAWLAFRDDEMAFNEHFWGLFSGSMYGPYPMYYRLYTVRKRAFELGNYFDKTPYSSHTYFDENTDIKTEEEWDKVLNEKYKLLMSKLGKENQDRLRTAQRKWIAYRDAESDCYDSCNLIGWNPDNRLLIVRERALRLGKYVDDYNESH